MDPKMINMNPKMKSERVKIPKTDPKSYWKQSK